MATRRKTGASISARQVQRITKALADPRRFEILKQIASGSCSSCAELRERVPITAATLSHHIKELEACGLVSTERRGKFMDATFDRETWNAYLGELHKM
ncbi:MAG TPA: metalloregulator ArsR/SmtB family transcription factor [Bryobacteraceae bacterium]|nr:metalloregulator ArsR/SmtB family transcription factor [Bryobacteraceae bacterium]